MKLVKECYDKQRINESLFWSRSVGFNPSKRSPFDPSKRSLKLVEEVKVSSKFKKATRLTLGSKLERCPDLKYDKTPELIRGKKFPYLTFKD